METTIFNYLYIENLHFFFQTRILHNLMPIFTFMGTSLLRHDDSYTFQVINKTLDTVVPTLLEVLSVRLLVAVYLVLLFFVLLVELNCCIIQKATLFNKGHTHFITTIIGISH